MKHARRFCSVVSENIEKSVITAEGVQKILILAHTPVQWAEKRLVVAINRGTPL